MPSGLYKIAYDESVSTNVLISLIEETECKNSVICHNPKCIIKSLTKLVDLSSFSLNTEKLGNLTDNYIVSNKKIKLSI